MEGERVFLSPILRPVERAVYRVGGVDEIARSRAGAATPIAVLVMAAVAIVAGYVVLRLQDVLPLNQGGIPAMSPELAFNTSVSFETNTNWQNYSGETGATYLTQAGVLAVRNFTSAATGLAIAIALFRGLTRRSSKTIGNYWVDLTRGDPLPAAADLDRRRARARVAGRSPDLGPDPGRHDARGRGPATSPSGPSPPRSGSRSWATTAAGS